MACGNSRKLRRGLLIVFASVSLPLVPAIEDANCTLPTTIRYSSSSDRLYLEGGGCITLAEIVAERTFNAGPKGPLYHFDRKNNEISDVPTGDYLLDSSLYVEDNVLLNVIGQDYGGDVSRLFLTSSAEKIINLRAYGGQVMIKGVRVRSFDRSANNGVGGADKNVTDGRSYISAITEVLDASTECDGRKNSDMGEARLDIIDSKISQLGYDNSESYGVSYKVRGLCRDNSNLDIMDRAAVWGDITGSELRYNYFGHYSYGHQAGYISDNEVHHNIGYGIDPHDDSDYMTITNNHVHHNGNHGIIASKRCNNAIIDGNRVYSNAGVGIMLHRSSDQSTISNNVIFKNVDAGIALFEASHNAVYNNKVQMNTHGIRWSVGSSNNVVHHNIFSVSGAKTPMYSIYMYKGSDSVDVEGSDGRPKNNFIFDNSIFGDFEVIKITSADGNTFTDNLIRGQFARFNDAIYNTVEGNEYWYIGEDDVTQTETEVVGDKSDLSGTMFGIVSENDSCFASDSGANLPTCDDDED